MSHRITAYNIKAYPPITPATMAEANILFGITHLERGICPPVLAPPT